MVEENNMITDANMAAERLEKATQESQAAAKRLEELQTRQILGGKSNAGEVAPPPREETPKEYAARLIGGKI
jgi:hypothetical protein